MGLLLLHEDQNKVEGRKLKKIRSLLVYHIFSYFFLYCFLCFSVEGRGVQLPV